jgi:hypothetical protein
MSQPSAECSRLCGVPQVYARTDCGRAHVRNVLTVRWGLAGTGVVSMRRRGTCGVCSGVCRAGAAKGCPHGGGAAGDTDCGKLGHGVPGVGVHVLGTGPSASKMQKAIPVSAV